MHRINILDYFFESNAAGLEITIAQLDEICEKATDEEIDQIIVFSHEATEEQKKIAKDLITKYCTVWE